MSVVWVHRGYTMALAELHRLSKSMVLGPPLAGRLFVCLVIEYSSQFVSNSKTQHLEHMDRMGQ